MNVSAIISNQISSEEVSADTILLEVRCQLLALSKVEERKIIENSK